MVTTRYFIQTLLELPTSELETGIEALKADEESTPELLDFLNEIWKVRINEHDCKQLTDRLKTNFFEGIGTVMNQAETIRLKDGEHTRFRLGMLRDDLQCDSITVVIRSNNLDIPLECGTRVTVFGSLNILKTHERTQVVIQADSVIPSESTIDQNRIHLGGTICSSPRVRLIKNGKELVFFELFSSASIRLSVIAIGDTAKELLNAGASFYSNIVFSGSISEQTYRGRTEIKVFMKSFESRMTCSR